jgi:hypothetical protein
MILSNQSWVKAESTWQASNAHLVLRLGKLAQPRHLTSVLKRTLLRSESPSVLLLYRSKELFSFAQSCLFPLKDDVMASRLRSFPKLSDEAQPRGT